MIAIVDYGVGNLFSLRSSFASLGLEACAQGRPVEIGGYYHADLAKIRAAMRPSATFNAVIDALAG